MFYQFAIRFGFISGGLKAAQTVEIISAKLINCAFWVICAQIKLYDWEIMDAFIQQRLIYVKVGARRYFA